MADIIRLLPDHVANQIAAGEVIQRPASVVKELLENSIDAGADRIRLIVQDAGRTLIQVIDNGSGMSSNDARLCFERHATSKIASADDLFRLRTKGFRGEAMASIAAIAHVELKTCLHSDPVGTRLAIEGSKVVAHEPCQTAPGSSIAVKNLFFNVPARRNFLKADGVELRHITDEFNRVALAHPDLGFELHHNGTEVYQLRPGNLRQRIVALFGPAFNEKLVPVEEATTIVKLNGFVGKPEFARKSKAEQFFFANGRFIRSNYFTNAVQSAFDDLLPDKTYPAFFLFIDVEPSWIDINIHPTKTEVKFEDERSLYAIIRSAVRQALGRHNISPTLDFDLEVSHQIGPPPKNVHFFQPELTLRPRPIMPKAENTEAWAKPTSDDWESLYDVLRSGNQTAIEAQPDAPTLVQGEIDLADDVARKPVQVHGGYILSSLRSGLMFIDIRRARERVNYERIIRSLAHNEVPTQQELFPIQVNLTPLEATTLIPLLDDVRTMGLDVRHFGGETFVVQAMAAFFVGTDPTELLHGLVADVAETGQLRGMQMKEKVARSMAARSAKSPIGRLSTEVMGALIDELFGCDMPYSTPSGKPTVVTLPLDELERRFQG